MFTEFELLKKYGSPLYTYDYNVLKDRCNSIKKFSNELEKGLPEGISVSMHYSTKANSNPAILSVVEHSGLNVDCMSPFELEVDQKSGFTSDRILYVCNNISAEEMCLIRKNSICIYSVHKSHQNRTIQITI